MTTTNPIFKATRAALTELTTPEAQAWYRTTASATAAGAMAIAHLGIATVGHLLRTKQDLLSGGEVTVPAEAAELFSPSNGTEGQAIKANYIAVVPVLRGGQSITSHEKSEVQAITVTAVDAGDEPSEDEGEEPKTDEEKEGGS